MHLPTYPILEIAPDHSTYRFISEGTNGCIIKVVIFTEFYPGGNIYNMALVDINANNSVSDESISNNGDIRKIFATVARVILEFLSLYPQRTIFFQGSDNEGRRTNVYHRAISQYYQLLTDELNIAGLTLDDVKEPFDPKGKYEIFLVTKR